jgi:hypothetical protein
MLMNWSVLVLDALGTSMACVCSFYRKLLPITKTNEDDGKGIDTSIGKRQDHNTRKFLSYQGFNIIVRVIQKHLETWRYYLHVLHIHVIARS